MLRLAATLALAASCGGEPADDRAAPSSSPPATLLWRELGDWTGRGDRQTESFEIASGALRLPWSARSGEGPRGEDPQGEDPQREDPESGRPEEGALRVSLHSAISGRLLETVVDHVGAGADTARFTAGPRVAYLLVESSGVDWRLRLEEAVAARSEAPPR